MFIIERKALIDITNHYVARGRYSFEKDYLLDSFVKKTIKINTFLFEGAVLRNHSITSYFCNSFRLMKPDIMKDIFRPDALIRTKNGTYVPF